MSLCFWTPPPKPMSPRCLPKPMSPLFPYTDSESDGSSPSADNAQNGASKRKEKPTFDMGDNSPAESLVGYDPLDPLDLIDISSAGLGPSLPLLTPPSPLRLPSPCLATKRATATEATTATASPLSLASMTPPLPPSPPPPSPFSCSSLPPLVNTSPSPFSCSSLPPLANTSPSTAPEQPAKWGPKWGPKWRKVFRELVSSRRQDKDRKEAWVTPKGIPRPYTSSEWVPPTTSFRGWF